jgi:hypothetical protein
VVEAERKSGELKRKHRHTHLYPMCPAPQDHPAQEGHVAVIAADRERHVVHIGEHVVGGVEIDPATLRAIHGHPRMRGIGTDQARSSRLNASEPSPPAMTLTLRRDWERTQAV